jgi:hypothetical protein
MAEMLATSCVTSGVPMLFIVILSVGACELHNSAKRTSQGDQAAAAPLVHDTRSCQLVSSRLSFCPPRAFPLWRHYISYDTKYAQHNRRTGVMSRTEQSLLLTSECDKLDIRAELDTKAFDGTRDRQKACRSGSVVVTTWRSCAAKRTSAVIVRTEEDRLGGILYRGVSTRNMS